MDIAKVISLKEILKIAIQEEMIIPERRLRWLNMKNNNKNH